MTKQYVQNPDGTKTEIKVVAVMTLDEMREAGAAKMADPDFVAQKIADAKKKAE
jgi:hypothetical protein